MSRKPFYLAVLVLAIMTLACNTVTNIPINRFQTGPTRTEDIEVPLPEDSDAVAEVELDFGAGRLQLSPGAEGTLISGTATYNVDEFAPEVSSRGNQVTISQNRESFEGIPLLRGDLENEWDLNLADAPMILQINAGAYEGIYELGGLAIQDLRITDGAAKSELEFSEPNQVEMDTLRYDTGASSVNLSGLANANFSEMIFKCGAGDYTLDFSGDLQRDASISIDSGLANVTIVVPEGVSASLTVDGGLTNVDVGGSWRSSGSEYTVSGDGPTLSFTVQMGAGNLQLESR